MSDIKGYKTLTDEQKSHINAFKNAEKVVLSMMAAHLGLGMGYPIDTRWFLIARTHFEEGFMAMNRAIAQPETVEF